MLDLQKVEEGSLRQVQFDLIQRFKRLTKVHQDEIALVTELRKQGAAHWGVGVGTLQIA
jgi:hypothetical protein